MEVFHWVVELGSFTKASDRLQMSKATVTTHIAALETRLGVRLLNRTTRRLSLTDDGAAYLEHCRRVLADVEETYATLTRGASVPRGRLRVDMPVSIGRQYIVPALPRFAAQYPELEVIATLDDRRIDLFQEGVDVALRVGALQDSSIIARKLFEGGYVTFASPEYLGLHGVPGEPADLARHNCLGFYMPAAGRVLDWAFEHGAERVAFAPGGALAVSSTEALVDAAVAGAGVVQLPEVISNRPIASGALQPILQDWCRTDRLPIAAIYPQNRHLSAKVRVFVDFVAGLFPRPRAHAIAPESSPSSRS